MKDIIMKLIAGKRVTYTDIENALYEICDREHSSCNDDCPIYKNVLTDEVKANSSCPYHGDGAKMLQALKKAIERSFSKKEFC